MGRKTVIRHPDGTYTEITTSTSLGRGCSATAWFLLALFLLVAPAAWWGTWSIFAYVAIAALVVAAVGKRISERAARSGPPTSGTWPR